MANLNVTGTILSSAYGVDAGHFNYAYNNPICLYDSENVTTGTKDLDIDDRIESPPTRYKFSDFPILLFCQFTSGAGWRVIMLPKSYFPTPNNADVVVEQNYTEQNRRVHLNYVNDSQFSINYVQNTNRFMIWGIQEI